MIVKYNPKLKKLARKLRNKSTKAEIRLWNQLRNGKLNGFDFHRQKPIDKFIVDFFCYKLRLCIEVDGVTHNDPLVQDRDRKKEARLKELGYNILRYQDNDVIDNIDGVILEIQNYIDRFED